MLVGPVGAHGAGRCGVLLTLIAAQCVSRLVHVAG